MRRTTLPMMLLAGLLTVPAMSGEVNDLTTFTAGTSARAAEVNDNFTNVATAINDNDASIDALTAELAELRATVASLEGCPTMDPSDEMIKVGGVCIDKYEASIWDAPVGGNQITGAIPCNANGQDCGNIYARSVAGVEPRASITWFQAQQALANSGKRFPTNAEWQLAVTGTPDGTPCNVDLGDPVFTASLPGCVSVWGTSDMVGNLWEWVAEWVPRSTCVGEWPSDFGGDDQALCGAADSGGPGALIRGEKAGGDSAGPFAVRATASPSNSISDIGFRGAR